MKIKTLDLRFMQSTGYIEPLLSNAIQFCLISLRNILSCLSVALHNWHDKTIIWTHIIILNPIPSPNTFWGWMMQWCSIIHFGYYLSNQTVSHKTCTCLLHHNITNIQHYSKLKYRSWKVSNKMHNKKKYWQDQPHHTA